MLIDLCLTVDGIQEPDFPRISVQTDRIQWTAEGEDEPDRFTNPAFGSWT